MTRAATLSVTIAIAIAAAPLSAESALPDGFVREKIVDQPFDGAPVAFTWLPDGRVMVVTRNGHVRLSAVGSSASTILMTVPDVTTQGERGLLGVAIDPLWPARPYVYLYATKTDSRGHLILVRATGDLTDPASTNVTLGSPYELLDDVPDSSDIHNAGTLRFGPDRMLYLSLGEDEDPCESQNVNTMQGVVLRLDVSSMPGAGSGPPPSSDLVPAGNPFPGPTDEARLVLAWGLRNPFRFTIDPVGGDLVIADVGFDGWEEINVSAAPTFGENFGWPRREGPDPFDPGDPCGTGNTFVDPAFADPHLGGAPRSLVAGPLYRGPSGVPWTFPAAYDGTIFYADYFLNWIRRLEHDGSDWVPAGAVPGQPNASDWATTIRSPADLQQGPEGALWYISMDFFGGHPRDGVYRIRPTSPLDAPAPRASGPSLRVDPNPSPPGLATTIRLEVPEGPVSLRVYDVRGRLVHTLLDGQSDGGRHTAVWSGAPAGVWFVRLESAAGTTTRKLVRLH